MYFLYFFYCIVIIRGSVIIIILRYKKKYLIFYFKNNFCILFMYLNKMFYFELIEIFLFLCDLKGFIYNIF